MEDSQKIVLVTGGSRGLGAATSRLAATNGYRVAVNYRAESAAAERVVADIRAAGGDARAFQADVAREEDVVRLFDEVVDVFGSIWGVVNNAGINGGTVRVDEFDAAALSKLMAVNVIGTMICCREAVRRMSTLHGGSGGSIVNVSSMASTIGGRPRRTNYAATKGAVDAFTIGLAKEVATEGIRVNAVRPGMAWSDMTAHLRNEEAKLAALSSTIAMKRIADASEIAEPIVWLLSPEASFVSGCRLDASGGGFVFG
ncbi:MAG: SDR family oxidoreductase [Alphaproteobacteria bacterium]|nr:SDR family oxidoreductase [Alphaproteobacteria bacterium]